MVLQREKMKGDITQWSGGSCLSNVLGDKEGRASHPLCALIPLTPTTLLAVWVQNQLQQLYAVEYRAEQYQLQWNVYSTQQSTKCMASQPAHLTSHLSQQGSSGGTQHWQLSSSHIESRSCHQQLPALSSLSPEVFRDPQQHQIQAPASAPLHSICTGVNWLLKARENQLSSAAKGEEMLCFHLYNLLFSKLPAWYEPAALCLPFPWRRLQLPIPPPALLQHRAPHFQQQREGEQNKEFMMKDYLFSVFFPSSALRLMHDTAWFYMQVTQSFFSHVHQALLENVAIIHQVLCFSQLPAKSNRCTCVVTSLSKMSGKKSLEH